MHCACSALCFYPVWVQTMKVVKSVSSHSYSWKPLLFSRTFHYSFVLSSKTVHIIDQHCDWWDLWEYERHPPLASKTTLRERMHRLSMGAFGTVSLICSRGVLDGKTRRRYRRICAIFQAGGANFLLLYVQNMLWTLVLASWALIQEFSFKHIAILLVPISNSVLSYFLVQLFQLWYMYTKDNCERKKRL